MDAQFLAELNERLFVHYADGQWRAPLGQRLLPVLPFDDGRMGRIVCAEDADIERALSSLGKGGVADIAALQHAWDRIQPMARQLRLLEGVEDRVSSPQRPSVPGEGPVVLLSAAQTPVADLVGVLLSSVARGVLWKPAPGAAASAHLVARALGPLMGGNLAMVQGDHDTGGLLVNRGALVWASPHAVPQGFAPPALILAAKAPHRR
ncbi:hypothetical protein [Pararhodobacter sp.]|uniref:hypothetical protein n=1 Tax=Pararhodobacter sp. TaxID=2127056 RepID=UPI002AFF8FA3|nr:hypothetical protein [Pararhodobacter sp.]